MDSDRVLTLHSRELRCTFFADGPGLHRLHHSHSRSAWHSLVRSLIPVDSLGDVFSKRVAWGRIVALGLTLGGGFFVDAWPTFSGRPPLEAYSVLFSIGILFGLTGVVVITRLPEPPMEVDHSESFRSLVWLPL